MNFSFGQPQQQQQQPATGQFSFGGQTQQQPAAPATSFSFGQPQQPQQQPQSTGFGFGQTPQPQQQAPANQFSFGSTPQQQQQQQPATGQFSFGTPTQPQQQQQQQQPTSGFSFSTPAQPQASTTGGSMFSFGNTTPATGLGLGGQTAGFSTTPQQQQQQTQPQPQASAFTGLGGTPSSANAHPFSSGGPAGMRSEHRATKELPLPVELVGLLDEIKGHMKTEKIKMAEISRASYKTVQQVASGLDEARILLMNVSNLIQRQTHNCEAFRVQIHQDIKNAEMAQLTRETPIALQTEHHQPTEYFYKLVRDYETRMTAYSREIQKAEAAIGSIGGSPGVTAQDLCVALKSSKDALVVLASKVKNLHDKVNGEIETHKNLLRFVHGEVGKDVFAPRAKGDTHEWKIRGSASNGNGSVLFPNRITDPTQMYMTYMAGAKSASVGGVLHSSTPIFSRSNLTPSKSYDQSSFNVSGFGSPTFYQPPTSPIFNPHNATSPPPSSGISLKRSKH